MNLDYMRGWLDGGEDMWSNHKSSSVSVPCNFDAEPYQRGYAAGRLAYAAAERAERERLERCPTCHGKLPTLGDFWPCSDCHGTGKRREG